MALLKHSTPLLLGFLAVLVAGCSSILGETPADSEPDGSVSTGNTSSSTRPADTKCVRPAPDNLPINTGTVAGDALFLAGETFLCASDVIVVDLSDLNHIAVASQLAAALEGPLLFPEPRLSAEIGRLKALRVHLVGGVEIDVPGDTETISHDMVSAVNAAKQALGVVEEVQLPVTPDASTIVETVNAIEAGDRVVLPMAVAPGATPPTAGSIDVSLVVVGLAQPASARMSWIVDAANPQTILLSSATGETVGAEVIAVDGTDLLGYPEVAMALAGRPTASIRTIGAQPEASSWEAAVLVNGQQVPGGGFQILPREGNRRYLAYYGHPGTTALGVLGEQGPDATRNLMQGFVDAYAGDDSQVVPTFEMIASVASAGPGDDGNYSYEWPSDTFTEWIDFARENDMYVVLDLQSGRADFLTQAKKYEDLLRLPFVGLALDPEWRLKPDQVHLEQVGTVDSVEINETINWVADLVRDNGLPQKMMIVHQFRTSMITNRQNIVERPEIQMIIQMDGDGTEPQKDNTFRTLLEGAENPHWSWGWKNFFDEDEPGPPSPESTMAKDPSPVFVSYQ